MQLHVCRYRKISKMCMVQNSVCVCGVHMYAVMLALEPRSSGAKFQVLPTCLSCSQMAENANGRYMVPGKLQSTHTLLRKNMMGKGGIL